MKKIVFKFCALLAVFILIYEKMFQATSIRYNIGNFSTLFFNTNVNYFKPLYSIVVKDGRTVKRKYIGVRDVTGNPEICRQFSVDKIIGQCKQTISWQNRVQNHSSLRTKATYSLYNVTLHFSEKYQIHLAKLVIKTYNRQKKKKEKGGDWWRVLVLGQQMRLNVKMMDQSDGTYIGWFVIKFPGEYILQIALEYSLCEGMTDPPLYWFQKGTVQGKFQPEGILGVIDQFLNENITDIKFDIDLTTTRRMNFNQNYPFPLTSSCQPINTACGYWRNGSYHGYHQDGEEINQKLNATNKKTLETFWIFGDSQGRRLYKSLKNHILCQKLFKNCGHTYTWTYKHISPDSYHDRFTYTGDDFNETKFLMDIKTDLQQKSMQTSRSVYLINFGVHIIMTIQLERAFRLFQLFLKMLNDMKEKRNENFPLIIWKSTTLPVIENSKVWNLTHARFLTKQRVEAWNSYTLTHACEAKLPILDVHDLPLATPYQPIDHVHYQYRVFSKSEDELFQYLLQRYGIA